MIDLKEIRIGNILWHKPGEWSGPGYNGLFTWSQSDWYALSECTLDVINVDPIEITEEWLLKFGFEVDKDNPLIEVCSQYVLNFKVSINRDYFNVLKFNLSKREGLGDFGYYSVNGNWGSVNFYYVHQLQNLYFALTGQELTIKEL